MRSSQWLAALCAALGVGLVTLAVTRAADSDEKKKEAQTAVRAFNYLSLAADLEEQGRHSEPKSPMSLLLAAKLLRGLKDPEPIDKEPMIKAVKGELNKEEGKVEKALPIQEQVTILLADADKMIKKQAADGVISEAEAAAMRTLAESIENPKKTSRGPIGGPKERRGWLSGWHEASWTFPYNGYSSAHVRVWGNGRNRILLEVRNSRNDLIARETDRYPRVTWEPPPEGDSYRIRIENEGDEGTNFRMITN